MFESIVASVLNSALGEFVEGLNAEDLNVSVFKGQVELSNLQIKTTAFDGLGVPVSLVAGHIGHIRLYADWKKLSSKAIRIEIDSVFACIKPEESYDAKEDSVAAKRARLTADELRWKASRGGDQDQDQAKSQSLFVQKILDNVQISITNVHIRVEDSISAQTSKVFDPAKCFALGVCLGRLAITSAVKNSDGTWSNQFIEKPLQLMTKRVQLGDGVSAESGLSVYCNTGMGSWQEAGGQPIPDPTMPGGGSSSSWRAAMLSMIDGRQRVEHVLRPLCMETVYLGDKSEGQGYDQAAWQAAEPSQDPCRRVVPPGKKHAPSTEVWGPFRDGLYRYEPRHDIQVEMDKVEVTAEAQTLQRGASLGAWAAKIARVQLYRKWRPPDHDAGLGPLVAPRAWWHYARKCVSHDNKLSSVRWAADQLCEGCQQRRVYMGYYTRKSGLDHDYKWLEKLSEDEQAEMQQIEDTTPVPVTLTWRRLALRELNDEVQRQTAAAPKKKKSWWSSSKPKFKEMTEAELEFLQAFEGAESTAKEYPEEWVETQMVLRLRGVAVTIAKQGRELACLDISDVGTKLVLRHSGGIQAEVEVASLCVSDRCSVDTVFPEIVMRDPSRRTRGQLLEMQVELKPLDSKADVRLKLLLQPLQVVFNPYLVEQLLAFMSTGEDLALEAKIAEEMGNSTRARAMQLKRRTEALRETALVVRKVMELEVLLCAPTIVIPDDCKHSTPECIVLSLGDLVVSSDEGTRTHDIFHLALKDMELQLRTIEVGHNPVDTRKTLPWSVLKPTSVELKLEVSARPTDTAVAKLKLSGRLPQLRLQLSDEMLTNLFGVVTTVTDKRLEAVATVRSMSSVSAPTDKPAVKPPKVRQRRQHQAKLRTSRSKSMRDLVNQAKSKHKLDCADDALEQQLPQWELVVANFELGEMVLAIDTQDQVHGDLEGLVIVQVQGLVVDYTQRPYDQHIVLGLRHFHVEDSYRAEVLGKPCHLMTDVLPERSGEDLMGALYAQEVAQNLALQQSVEARRRRLGELDGGGQLPPSPEQPTSNLLDVDFWDTDQNSPVQWRKDCHIDPDCVGRKVVAHFGTLSLYLHLGTVAKLLDLTKVVTMPPRRREHVNIAALAAKDRYWAELSQDHKVAARRLGWSGDSWDADDKHAFDTPWERLSESQEESARLLGFTMKDWYNETPAKAPTAVLDATMSVGRLSVQLVPELAAGSSHTTLATLHLASVDARINVDAQGVLETVLQVGKLSILRGGPQRKPKPSDYVLSVRKLASRTADESELLLDVHAVMQPDTRPEIASTVRAMISGLDIVIAGPFVASLLQWANDNPIGKEDAQSAKQAAANAKRATAKKAKENKPKKVDIDAQLGSISLTAPLELDAGQDLGNSVRNMQQALQVELGEVVLKVEETKQCVFFHDTWIRLDRGGKRQALLQPISGDLTVEIRDGIERYVTVAGLTAIEANLSFRDLLTLQAIAASMSTGPSTTADESIELAPDSAILPKTATETETESSQLSVLDESETDEVTESESASIHFQLPTQLHIKVQVLDDCTAVSKPFLTACAALCHLQVTQRSGASSLGGTLVLQLDGFDSIRGHSLALLERFNLDFSVEQKDTLTEVIIGADAAKHHPEMHHSGTLQLQINGNGDFHPAELTLDGTSLRMMTHVGPIEASTVKAQANRTKSPRPGQPFTFSVYLDQPDSQAIKKYVLAAATASEMQHWIQLISPALSRAELTVTDSFLNGVQVTMANFKELQDSSLIGSGSRKTAYGDCVLRNETGIALSFGRVGAAFDAAQPLASGEDVSVSNVLSASEASLSKRNSLRRPRTVTTALSAARDEQDVQACQLFTLWLPENLEPSNPNAVAYEASVAKSAVVSFGGRTISLELNRQGTGGATVLAVRSLLRFHNCGNMTVFASIRNGVGSSLPCESLAIPGGTVVGVPLTIKIKSAYVRFGSTLDDDASFSEPVALSSLIPYGSDSSAPINVKANGRWLRVAGNTEPVQAVDKSAGMEFCGVRREQQVTLSIGSAVSIRNNMQPGVDIEYGISNGSSLGGVADLKSCRLSRCETRRDGSGLFGGKEYTVYVFEVRSSDGAQRESVKRYSQFHAWYASLDSETTMYMPTLPTKKESLFRSAKDIEAQRSEQLTLFLNDALQAGSTYPPVAQAVRFFLLDHLLQEDQAPREEGKVRFGTVEPVCLRHFQSLTTKIELELYAKIDGVGFKTMKPVTLLNENGAVSSHHIELVNRKSTPLRLNLSSIVHQSGAHEFTLSPEFCLVNSSGWPMVYRAEGDDAILGHEGRKQNPSAVAEWMCAAPDSAGSKTPFSFRNPERENKLVVCIRDGQNWQQTNPISIDATGSKSIVEVKATVDCKAKQFGVRISTQAGNATCKDIQFVPRFVACNHTEFEIDIAQVKHGFHADSPRELSQTHSEIITERMQRGSRAFHFPRHTKSSNERMLSFRVRGRRGCSLWSPAFNPQLADFPLLLRDEEAEPLTIVRVNVTQCLEATILIHVIEQWNPGERNASEKYNYTLRNLSQTWDMLVQQKSSREQRTSSTQEQPPTVVPRYDTEHPSERDTPFGWDRPPTAKQPGVVLVAFTGGAAGAPPAPIECKLDELGVVQESGPRVEVVAEGGTKVLKCSDDAVQPMAWHLGARLGLNLDPRPQLQCSREDCRHKARASVADGVAFLKNHRHQVRCERCNAVMWITPPEDFRRALAKDGSEDKRRRLAQHPRMKVDLNLGGLGLSIVRSPTASSFLGARELLYVSLRELRVEIQKDVEKMNVGLRLRSIQVDSMMPQTTYPQMIYPVMEKNRDVLELTLVRMEDTEDLQHFKTLQVQLQTIQIKFDFSVVIWLFAFGRAIVPYQDIVTAQAQAQAAQASACALALQASKMGVGMLYFEELIIGPVQILVSSSPDNHIDKSNRADMAAVKAFKDMLPGATGVVLHMMFNQDGLKVQLNGFNLNDAFQTPQDLSWTIFWRYRVMLLGYTAPILGFSLLPADPFSLGMGILGGVQDFFYEPAKGIVQSPEEFGKGVARGGLSFLQGTVGSAFTFSSSLLGSVGNLANALGGSDESDIQLFSPTAKQNQSRGMVQGTKGLGTDVTQGLVDGVTGIFTKPVQGAMEGGFTGMVGGLAKGIVGVAAKPVAGVATGVSGFVAGIAEDMQSIGDARMKSVPSVRDARWISPAGRVYPFDTVMAIGQARLWHIVATCCTPADQRALKMDILAAYIECGEALEILVTDAHILHCGQEAGQWRLLWSVAFRDVEGIDVSASSAVASTIPHVVIHCKPGGRSPRGTMHSVTCIDAQRVCNELKIAMQSQD